MGSTPHVCSPRFRRLRLVGCDTRVGREPGRHEPIRKRRHRNPCRRRCCADQSASLNGAKIGSMAVSERPNQAAGCAMPVSGYVRRTEIVAGKIRPRWPEVRIERERGNLQLSRNIATRVSSTISEHQNFGRPNDAIQLPSDGEAVMGFAVPPKRIILLEEIRVYAVRDAAVRLSRRG